MTMLNLITHSGKEADDSKNGVFFLRNYKKSMELVKKEDKIGI
jgi:hypothetical protein